MCCLLQELLSMRQADATAKAPIFSSFQPTVDFLKQVRILMTARRNRRSAMNVNSDRYYYPCAVVAARFCC
jgi:hypothetical protein